MSPTLSNHDFATTVLLVASNGARWSEDPRTYTAGETSPYSRGWYWYLQVEYCKTSEMYPLSLYHMQFIALNSMFLFGSSVPHSWTIAGFGVTFAQEAGAHRRKRGDRTPTMEDELWKRAIWVLVALDRMTSVSLGRPCSLRSEDLDAEYPIALDDEDLEDYLADPHNRSQKSPIPSLMDYFISMLDLLEIQAVAMRTIYSIHPCKIFPGTTNRVGWEQRLVSNLDAALNKWMQRIPHHLYWNPDRELGLFFSQSAVLYCLYYGLQISIHRPFIPTPESKSSITFRSLAICTNAARSCINIVDVYRQRTGLVLALSLCSTFRSAIMLMWNIWSNRDRKQTHSREMADIVKCIPAIKIAQDKFQSAGQMFDILVQLSIDSPEAPSHELSSGKPASQEGNYNYFTPSSSQSKEVYINSVPDSASYPAAALPWSNDYSFEFQAPFPTKNNTPRRGQNPYPDVHGHTKDEPPTVPMMSAEETYMQSI